MTTDIDTLITQIRQRGQIEQAAETAAELDAMRQRIAELEQHILMLTKLPTWKPVEDGYSHLCHCIDCANGEPDAWGWVLYVNGDGIGIEDPDNTDDDRWVLLPDGVRLCRFTPAADWVDWEKVPPGFDWVAADGNGQIYAYVDAPASRNFRWECSKFLLIPGTLPLGIDWRQSLRRRPGSEEER